jgi:hypothetical protein
VSEFACVLLSIIFLTPIIVHVSNRATDRIRARDSAQRSGVGGDQAGPLANRTELVERIEQDFQTSFRAASECWKMIGILQDCEVGFNALGYTQEEITQDPAWKRAKGYTLIHLKRVHADCLDYLENVEAVARILEIKRYVGIAMSLCDKCSGPKVEGEDFRCAVLEVLSKLNRK